MTRVELFETLRRLGYQVQGLSNNHIRIDGGKAISEDEAMEFMHAHHETHCITCGRPYSVRGHRGRKAKTA